MEIEKLKDMLRNAAGGPVGIQMCQEAADALEQLQAENEKLKAQVPRWIPVEERRPATGDNPILIYKVVNDRGMNKNIGTAWYSSYHGWIPTNGTKVFGITHWMPLPKAPKEVTHEK